jgi:Mg-chelatase subunit ChlD
MKAVLIVFVTILSLGAQTLTLIDISRGLSRPVFNEVGRLTQPKPRARDCIYRDGERASFVAFNSLKKAQTSFLYRDAYKKESGYKKANRTFTKFFTSLKRVTARNATDALQGNVIMLVDTSGSMKKGGVMEEVKRTMRYLAAHKAKRTTVTIVTFDGKAQWPASRQARIVCGPETDPARLETCIDALHASHADTFLGAGLQLVNGAIRADNAPESLVLLFSDGKAVDDTARANAELQKLRDKGVRMKVVAVGGANPEVLRAYSPTGYIYNATSADLQGMVGALSLSADEIFLRLNGILSNLREPLGETDRILIYSSMVNVDDQSDFNIVPNLASDAFFKEMERINKARGLQFDFGGAELYVRVTGAVRPARLQTLRRYWERFFKTHHGRLRFFDAAALHKEAL